MGWKASTKRFLFCIMCFHISKKRFFFRGLQEVMFNTGKQLMIIIFSNFFFQNIFFSNYIHYLVLFLNLCFTLKLFRISQYVDIELTWYFKESPTKIWIYFAYTCNEKKSVEKAIKGLPIHRTRPPPPPPQSHVQNNSV